jgi:threonine dehydrogenase-like Zn-dependent dehydrogenase
LVTDLVLKNQVILGSVNASREHFEHAVADLVSAQKKWPGVIEQFITHTIPSEQFKQALVKRGPIEIKAVIQW